MLFYYIIPFYYVFCRFGPWGQKDEKVEIEVEVKDVVEDLVAS